MCGIIGIVGQESVSPRLYDGLTLLQHRGQDAAGIATCHEGRLILRRGAGLVRDVFSTGDMQRLEGTMGIAHVRYPTAGTSGQAESQPFYVNSPYGIVMGHNGNLTNADVLKRELFESDLRHINTQSDSEVLLNVFAHELQDLKPSTNLTADMIFSTVAAVHRRCRGAYAVIGMVVGRGVFAFRDPLGIRPAVIGHRQSETGTEYAIASESVALQGLGFNLLRDIAPGEAVYIDVEGNLHTEQCAQNPVLSPCIFEYVYLARPDSIIDNISVYKSRLRMGETLARRILQERPDHDIDVVIPIPDTSRTSALEVAVNLGVKYREGFIKNRYIGRTFIMPGQQLRKKSVRQKLSPIDLEFNGKTVLLVDDSIVRGTTSGQIVQMARDAGAKKVYFASASPPVRHPNVYGIDMPAVEELIAHDKDTAEIEKAIGADWLVYQTIEDLIEAVRYDKHPIEDFETSCFTGEYITGDVDKNYLDALEKLRSDNSKRQQSSADDLIVL
ncbi:amidophosphoribosyltransferase [Granulosicoccus antarcticus]|uniref:Amidophosphoribosyltransferase n=1 Tax=Granulosicoccus antarcticus IMCC3135 TaxID=1192854 RepID=A0A2Z2P3U6_9GAMM|nr:amidophosphoribosyltransferase [Granulosicoccus antarcticus]ASJ75327.1 Amidophosphoribosyltransferase [Granulosicoccus antarcticus IMCC3135]